MRDSRADVRPGQRLNVAAAQINFLNRLMRPDTSIAAGPLEQFDSPYVWVYCKNSTNATIQRWGVLAISGVEITPTIDADAAATTQFQAMPVLTGDSLTNSPTSERCVAIEPIKQGEVGRVAVSGVVQVKATDVGNLPGSVVLWKNDFWALIRFGQDKVRLCKTTATWEKNTTATLEVWESGTPPNETKTTGQTLEAVNKTGKVSANVFVIVAKGQTGKWYLVEAASCDDSGSGSGSGCGCVAIAGHDLTSIDGYDDTKTQVLGHEQGCLKWIDTTECS